MLEDAMLSRRCRRAWRIDGHYDLVSDDARSRSLMIFDPLGTSIEERPHRDSRNGTIAKIAVSPRFEPLFTFSMTSRGSRELRPGGTEKEQSSRNGPCD